MQDGAVVPQPGGDWLCGVFGYESIEDHMKWREHPEHDKPVEVFEDLKKRNLTVKSVNVPGIDPDTGYFHVKFSAGT